MRAILAPLHRRIADSAAVWNVPATLALTVFWAPIVGSMLFIVARLDKSFYRMMLEEDGPVEWIQFLCFLTAGVAAVGIARYRHAAGFHRQAAFFVLFALGMFFISGEEISWGQRLLGIETPKYLEAVNKQGEITLHNVGSALKVFRLGMFCVALVSGMAFLWNKTLKVGNFLDDGDYLFAPPLILAPTFMVMVIYRTMRATVLTERGFTLTAYAEWCELCLAFGLFSFAALNFRRYALQTHAACDVEPSLAVSETAGAG